MKKFIAALLAVVIVMATVVISFAANLGDVNGDNNINSSDALLVLRYSVGDISFNKEEFSKADVNKDGSVNSVDALRILEVSVGIGSFDENASSSNPNVLSFSKAQLIDYYNSCLKNSYSQSKMTDTKVEHVDVSISGVDIGSLNIDIDKFANSIIENNTKNNDKPNTKTFSRGVASDGTAASTFVLPTNLYAAAVRTYSVSQNGSGYVVSFTLNQESCSHTGTAAYNASCAWPLDINSIDFGSAVTIQSCTFNYPGTKLTANIDSQDRVSSVKVEMPLTVANAQGKALGVTIKVGSISGKWTCTNTMTF